MRFVGKHEKPAAEIFEHYLECLDKGDTITFERDLQSWIANSNSTQMKLELRRIWYRIIDGDLDGAKTMVLELQEQYIDWTSDNTVMNRLYDRRLKEKGL